MLTTFASFMRIALVLVAVVNLGVALLLPGWAYGRTAAVYSQWMLAEKSLVKSGQLVVKPADPGISASGSPWLYQELAAPILEREAPGRLALALFLLAQSALLIVAAFLIGDKTRGSKGAESMAPA
jgi:hypothetical protein